MSLNKEVKIDEMIDIMTEKLEAGGTVTFTPRGTSMMPMLRDGEDIVVLSKCPDSRLHLFDLPLYKRPNGQYVLHRIIDFDKDGSYVMCGDNQFSREHGVRDSDITAIVTAFYRKGKAYSVDSFRYRVYVDFWYYTRPFRRIYRFVVGRIKKLTGIRGKSDSDKAK